MPTDRFAVLFLILELLSVPLLTSSFGHRRQQQQVLSFVPIATELRFV
jgi:hypothetical protein